MPASRPTTKGTTNTWHFGYIPVDTGYQMCFSLYKNGQLVKSYPNYPTGGHPAGNGNGMCTTAQRGLSQQGTIPYTESNLQNGATYEVCAVSFENYEPPTSQDQVWFMRVKTLDSCSRTTIDNGAPSLTTWVGGEATYTQEPDHPRAHGVPGRAQPPLVAEPLRRRRAGRDGRLPDP